jgi:flagellar M-ring protein FliF
VAVVVDDLVGVDENGEPSREPLSQDVLTNLTMLVKQAVGFDEKRGDKVHIVNASFQPRVAADAMPETQVWKQPWVWDLGKQVLGVLGVLLLLLLVLRPVMRDLAAKGEQVKNAALPKPEGLEEAPALESESKGELDDGKEDGAPAALTDDTSQLSENQLENYNETITQVKAAVTASPVKAASILNGWLTQNAE